MSAEIPGSHDAIPPHPPSGEGGVDITPGYPPPGQAEQLAALQAAEAASRPDDVDGQLANDLAALEAGSETPNQRRERLGVFIDEYFSDVCPAQFRDAGVDRCCAFEDQCRELFGEPTLRLAEADAGDAGLKEEIQHAAEIAANDAEIAAQTETRDAALATEAEQTTTRTENEAAIDRQTVLVDKNREALTDKNEELSSELSQEATISRDLQTVGELQENFERVKAANGGSTIAALESLLAPETGVKSPEMRAIVQRTVATARAMMVALPGREAAVEQLLNTSGLKLAGASQAEVFAGLFAAAETSEDFSDEEVARLRAVVTGADTSITTGTDVLNAATATTVDPETGETIALHTKDNRAEVRPGVYAYTETGDNAVLELDIDGHYHKIDVTGMDGMTVGLLAEMMSWQAATESFGATSFVESVYKIDFTVLGSSAYDPISLLQMRQRLTLMVGSFEGYDGDIFDPRERMGLIQDQMRAASPTGTALGWENDHAGSVEHSRKLGLENNVVLEEFSRYIQDARAKGGAVDPDIIHQHLYTKFPDLVEAPDNA